jgi:hypothetical protein
VSNPRVFITQQPAPARSGWMPNLTPAERYGALEYVFSAEYQPYLYPQKALRQAEEALRDFDPERDYVLWPNTGCPMAAWAVMLTLGRKGLRQIKALKFDRGLVNGERDNRNGFYTPITFRFN